MRRFVTGLEQVCGHSRSSVAVVLCRLRQLALGLSSRISLLLLLVLTCLDKCEWHKAAKQIFHHGYLLDADRPQTLRLLADTLLAIHEGEQDGDVWFAKSIEVKINADRSVTFLSTCKVDFPLPEGNKKGFEGAEYIDKGPDGEYLLGLCEGNHCEVCYARLTSQPCTL